MNSELMFSQATDIWGTPQWLFDALDKEFGFTLDPCSDGTNAKCDKFYSITDSGLLKDWGTETVFMNPPYSQCDEWMRKAYGAAQEGATVVCLVPSRTDTEWWHRYAMKGEVRLIKGRLKFGGCGELGPLPKRCHRVPAARVQADSVGGDMTWADGACPSCGGEEWDVERHWGQPTLSVYTCPCGAWDHMDASMSARQGAQQPDEQSQLSVNSGAEMAQPDEQNPVSRSSLPNRSVLPREPL